MSQKLTLEHVREVISSRVVGRVLAVPSPLGERDGRHWYSIDGGAPVLSVTTKNGIVAKPHLYKWYAERALEWMEPMWPLAVGENKEKLFESAILAGELVRDDAGNVGTAGHVAVDSWLQPWIRTGVKVQNAVSFLPQNADTRAVAFVRSIEKFFHDFPQYVPAWSELLVGCPATSEYSAIAGTLDILLWNTNTQELEVWDWKSSNSVDATYSMQVSAYRHSFEFMTGLPTADFCGIVKGSKWSDRYEAYKITHPHKAFMAYQHGSALYDWLEEPGAKPAIMRNIITL